MAHSTPTTIENTGDAWRLTTTAGGFVVALVTDPRVEAAYADWLSARITVTDRVERMPAARRPALWESWASHEHRATSRLVADLGLSAWVSWLVPALLHGFECRALDREFAIPVQMLKGSPRGRRPRNNGDELIRNAEWLYRIEVKNPPDSVKAVAREYVAARAADGMTVQFDTREVRLAVRQARAYLDILGREGLTPPTRPTVEVVPLPK